MNGKFFLDTNIFVYTFDVQAPAKAELAAQLVQQAADTGRGVISYQVVQEFFNVAFRRFSQPMSAGDAEQYLTTVLKPLIAVHSSPVLFLKALDIYNRERLSWYDSLIVAAALQAKCQVLFSEDLQHGRKLEGLHIENPFN